MNKKIITLTVVLIILGVTVSFLGLKVLQNKESDTMKVVEETQKENDNEEVVTKNEEEKIEDEISYENLAGLQYIILRNEKVEKDIDNTSLLMDIQVEARLTDKQIASLGEEVYKVLSKEVSDTKIISNISINTFTKKEAFEKTIADGYDGSYVDGLVHNYSAIYQNGNNVIIKNYEPLQFTEDKEAMQATLDFNVANANRMNNRNDISADVIMKTDNEKSLGDMVKSLVEMITESNKNAEDITLRLFYSKAEYDVKKLSYKYTTSDSNVIVQYVYPEIKAN